MHPAIKNILAVLAGFVCGSVVNMGLITVSSSVIAPPGGADVRTMEGLIASMHLFEPRHFLFPFLAHALGTLVGAAVAAFFSASGKLACAMLIGVLFMAGGIANIVLLPSPLWYSVVDVLGAYLPMAWLGWKLGARKASPHDQLRTA